MPTDPTDQAIRARLLAPLAPLAPCSRHVDPARLALHAAGELEPDDAHAVTAHLAQCADGRCLDRLREALAGESAARDALYALRREEHTDPSIGLPHRQSAHTIRCESDLWTAFEALAREEGCSTDWLINEAMKAYTQQRAQSRSETPRPSGPSGLVAPRDVAFHRAPSVPPSRESVRERNTPTLQRSYLPKAPPSSRRSPVYPPPAGAAPKLAVVIEGVRYEVTKDRFVVGRGGRSSDLAIDDPGVSRQHALIEHNGEEYWLVDMGSTNGIEYQGERIARRRIAHGDRFLICDHELEFLLH